jgi:anti-sigma-K factor RskA
MRIGHRAEMHLTGLPQPPIGEVYEVWLTAAGGAPKATDALFTPTAAGTAAVEVPGSLRGIRAITVTAEPRGGSSHPTAPVLLRVALSRAGG